MNNEQEIKVSIKSLSQQYSTIENILLFIVVSTAALLGFAFILEFFVDLVPCPLCIVQRFFYLLIGITALLAVLPVSAKYVNTKMAGRGVILWSILGGAVAGRQIWLQHLPKTEDSVGCAVSFGSILDSILYALGGRGNCSIVDWTFLTLSIAEWSFIWFGIFFIVGSMLLKKSLDKKEQ